VDEVIEAFIDGRLDDPVFRMPGFALDSSIRESKAEKDTA
jgi:hypothetical protein